MPDRFFAESPITGNHVELHGPEAHHLLHVLRAKVGDEVTLFDGSGAEFAARLEKIGRSSVELAVLSRSVVDRELAVTIAMGVALPKGDRQKWLVEKLTELGVNRLVPLETRRGVAQPIESALERLRRSVVEASKQCGRNRLMTIDSPQPVEHFLAQVEPRQPRLFAHPGGTSLSAERPWFSTGAADAAIQSVTISVGPEGGFTEDEFAAAVAAGWQPVDLGSRLLRVETAAITLAAIIGAIAR